MHPMIHPFRTFDHPTPGYVRRSNHDVLAGPIVIRYSTASDSAALERLAALDGRRPTDTQFLLAEVGGVLVAAAPVDGLSEPLADPFRPTADIAELLKLRARRIREHRRASSPARRAA
jgi:hypothetical protein